MTSTTESPMKGFSPNDLIAFQFSKCCFSNPCVEKFGESGREQEKKWEDQLKDCCYTDPGKRIGEVT